MFEIIICDDEIIDRKLVRAMVEKYMAENHVDSRITEFSSADEFMSAPARRPDVIFLDIYMEGMDGVELAHKIREQNKESQIVFITSSNEFASDAFEVEALSYLRKPVNESKLREVLDRVMQRMIHTRFIDVNSERSSVRIYLSDIVYIETLGRRLAIHTDNDSVMTYMSLAKIIDELPETEFVRTSRFEVASLSHIELISGKEIKMSDGKMLQISQNFVDELTARYEDYRSHVIHVSPS